MDVKICCLIAMSVVIPDGKFSEEWVLNEGGYDDNQFLAAINMGIVSAGIMLCVAIQIGICKQIFARIRSRVEGKSFLKEVLPPAIGGLAIGAVNWVLPATVGNGHLTTPWVLAFGPQGKIPQRMLISCGFARAFLLSVSMNCGFIGGFVFPMLSIGAISGVVANLQYPELVRSATFIRFVIHLPNIISLLNVHLRQPVGLTVGCFMFAIPCGIVPLPFTFTVLGCFIFFFGLYETVPIFVSILVSYLLICGSGIFQRLRSGQQKKNDGNGTAAEIAVTAQAKAILEERKHEREEEEIYAVNQYATRAARMKGDNELVSPLV